MVNSPSIAAVQANDTESKRRKQTLERARANHLSRQLQMRLQYARLKVDHGWQKQSLNEVENLYFHHSHMRGPRPYPSASTLTTLVQPSLLHPSNTTRTHPTTQSSLSFKQHIVSNKSAVGVESSNNGTASISINVGGQLDEVTGSDIEAVHVPPTTNISPPLIDPALLPPEDSLISMGVDPDLKLSERMPSPLDDPFISNTTFGTTTATASTTKPKSKSSSKSKSKSSRSPHSPSQGISTLANNANASSLPANSHSNNNLQSSSATYEFGNSTLTYDSFWSSHSTASISTGPGSMTAQSYRNVFGVGVGAGEVETGRSGGSG